MKPIHLFLRVLLPVAIGIAAVVWLFCRDFSTETWDRVTFDWQTVAALAMATLFVIGRDLGLAWRFHTIASPDLTWRRAIRVDLMCAFTSAITPSAVGGSALAVFYLNREGVPVGRATTLTLTTLFLDELFFVVFCPILILLIPSDMLFSIGNDGLFMRSVQFVFWTIYAGIVAYTALLFMGIIVKPHWVAHVVDCLFRVKLLRRWHHKAVAMTDNMVSTSAWVKRQSWRWWGNVFGATVVSWFSRYFVVNAIMWGFAPAVSGLLVFGRQFVVWVLLMVSPTPGGSGVSEWLFSNYYGDLIGNAGIAILLATIWRILSYYIYLAAGACLLPGYFKTK